MVWGLCFRGGVFGQGGSERGRREATPKKKKTEKKMWAEKDRMVME